MNNRRDIINVSIVFLVALLYVIFVNERIGTIIFIFILFGITIYLHFLLNRRFNEDKESSLGVILKRLDKSQRENEETYKRFLSLSKTLGSGVFMIDDEGKISFSNKDIENFFNKDFNNLDYNEIVYIKPLYKFVNKAYLTEQTQREQISYDDKVYDLTATPIFEQDMFSGSLILVHDITLLKTAEKFQKRFTADVSHELRTPLSAIKGFSEILNRDNLEKKDRKEFVTLIQQEADRMEIILKDLTTISKLDRLDYDLEYSNHNIKDVITESVTLLKAKMEEKELTFSGDVEDCTLTIDKVKMSQVIINIIKNAINYTDVGYIRVDGFKERDFYKILISDSGIGIPENKQDLIFKRFYRIDKARSRDTGGSGLGLSISKNVVLKHGGEISVESEINEGSVFMIKLPLKK